MQSDVRLYSKTSISDTPKFPGGSCHLSNCATYGITFMYKRYSFNFDGSRKSVPHRIVPLMGVPLTGVLLYMKNFVLGSRFLDVFVGPN